MLWPRKMVILDSFTSRGEQRERDLKRIGCSFELSGKTGTSATQKEESKNRSNELGTRVLRLQAPCSVSEGGSISSKDSPVQNIEISL